MKRMYIRTILLLMTFIIMFLSSCIAPLSAEESIKEREHYQEKYANEQEPSAVVKTILSFLESCVGGTYVYGGQGNKITREYINNVNSIHPEYFSHGRFEYFSAIAVKAERQGLCFPNDYAWDCSGLWWYACNSLKIYPEYTDRTAHDTYYDYCIPLSKEELIPGDLVFLENLEGRITHMGIVGKQGYIYEAVSGFIGVVKKRTIDKRIYNDIVRGGIMAYQNWNLFGRPKIFED